jgi:hypothetical protein
MNLFDCMGGEIMQTLTWSSDLRKAALATKQVESIKFNTVVSNFNLSSEEKTAFSKLNTQPDDTIVLSSPWN